MTALSETKRQKIWQLFMARGHCPGTITKAQARAAVDALDDWIDTTGAVSINNSFPQPFKAEATADQKAIVLAYIALERAGVL